MDSNAQNQAYMQQYLRMQQLGIAQRVIPVNNGAAAAMGNGLYPQNMIGMNPMAAVMAQQNALNASQQQQQIAQQLLANAAMVNAVNGNNAVSAVGVNSNSNVNSIDDISNTNDDANSAMRNGTSDSNNGSGNEDNGDSEGQSNPKSGKNFLVV